MGAMKLNERSVAHYALSDSPADHAGFLRTWGGAGTPPTPSGTGRRCWFVLKGNLLFSFESREGRAPLSLVVLEGCTVELAEAPVPEEFAFAIRFDAPGVRPHLLAADGPAAQEAWVKALSRASFGYMRLVMSFGLLRVFSVVIPFLYVGTLISKNFAALLEEHDIFVPEDDDDDD
ncbi:hypothetical protein E2I00_002889 [Balaenoptera physalus]|uniref:Essential MCU regulator, mitochondrial n=1 Tax=Balaenoptera physalus TaxID=9770 RepID=A0A643BY56_BALPH|nr:hypothetical protein E2I00_002889 [Balaenoptera physalus]